MCVGKGSSRFWLPVRMEPLDYHREDFREILLGILIKICRENSCLVNNRRKNIRRFSRRPKYVYDISSNTSKYETKSKYTFHAKYIFSTKMPFKRYEKYGRPRESRLRGGCKGKRIGKAIPVQA